MATSKYIDQQAEHRSVIQMLINETHQPVEDVNRIYNETFDRLSSDARVKDFLVLLTVKSVRDSLRHPG